MKCKGTIVALLLFGFILSSCGGSGGGNDNDGDISTTTISGTVSVLNPSSSVSAILKTTEVSGATVQLIKVDNQRNETVIETTTTDDSGNYSFSDVPISAEDLGSDDDYLYIVTTTSGDTTFSAPVKPKSAEEDVDITDGTTLAASIIQNVVDLRESDDNPPIPEPEVIETLRIGVKENFDDESDSIDTTLGASTDSNETVTLAEGIVSMNGNGEKTFKAANFAAEYIHITSDTETSDEELREKAGGYLQRVLNEACDQPTAPALSSTAAQLLASALIDGTTFTPTEVCEAFEGSEGGTVDCGAKIENYGALLENSEPTEDTDLNLVSAVMADLDINDQVATMTKRDLNSADFTEETPLTADQALSFMHTLSDDSNEVCDISTDTLGVTYALLEEDDASAIEIQELHNDSGFGCNDSGEGHFHGRVRVHLGGKVVDSVTATSSISTDLDGDGTVTLNDEGEGKIFGRTNNDVCVTLNQEITYTITANFTDGTSVSATHTTTHFSVPEDTATTLDDLPFGEEINDPLIVDVPKPTIVLDENEEVLAGIDGAPEGSHIMKTYVVYHYKSDGTVIVNSTACPSDDDRRMIPNNVVIPTVACDPVGCAAEQGVDSSQIVCYINTQQYLVDKGDRIISQAAGKTKYFCVDTNSDGDCGE